MPITLAQKNQTFQQFFRCRQFWLQPCRFRRKKLKKFAILEFDSYNKENESAEAGNQKKIPEGE